MSRLSACCFIVSMLVKSLTFVCEAQTSSIHTLPVEISSENHSRFDIVSIHETAPASAYSQRLVDDSHSGQFLATSYRLSQLVAEAFGVNFLFQVLDLPKEIRNRRFDITAKSDEATDRKLRTASDEQALRLKHQMLQALLMDRFHLRYRIESRPLPSFELQIAPRGTTLKQLHQKDGEGVGFRTERADQGIEIEGKNVAIDALPTVLSFYLKSTVVNHTDLAGTYDLNLKFDDTPAGSETTEAMWSPLQVAVQEQLGLKLFPIKLPTTVIVVEHIEMPTPN